jgi:predicted alpha/beta hydrolase
LYAEPATKEQAGVALIHGGAGVPAARYAPFAAFLAQSGLPTMTYDYRGIGPSARRAPRRFDATMEDWAEYDCAGAIAWLHERYRGARMIGIGHSIGGLLVGGAHNAAVQSRLVLIGAHTGYWGDYGPRYRLLMTFLWHGLMPAITRLFGYFPARRLGLGEDIPKSIALQWAGRRSPELRPAGTRPGAARVHRLLERCAALQRPVLVVSISDDAFATPAATARLMSYYPNLSPVQHLHFTPADAGLSRIGHFGFFGRRAGAHLWPRLRAELG